MCDKQDDWVVNIAPVHSHMTTQTCCRSTWFVIEKMQVTKRVLRKDLWKMNLRFFTVMISHMTGKSICGQIDSRIDVTNMFQQKSVRQSRSSPASEVLISNWSVRFSVLQILYKLIDLLLFPTSLQDIHWAFLLFDIYMFIVLVTEFRCFRECSPVVRETGIQSQVESYQRCKKLHFMPP